MLVMSAGDRRAIRAGAISPRLGEGPATGSINPRSNICGVQVPLAELVAQGKGSLRLPIAVRCRDCGEPGRLQVRPPMPTWKNANGWIQLP